mgnify:CR=1 FL=1
MFHLFLFSLLSSCASLNQVFSPSKNQKPKESKIESSQVVQDFVLNGKFVIFVGDKGFSGPVIYQGIEEAMELNNVSVHIYGKSETKPNRKMGHITVIDNDLKEGLSKAKNIKELIKIKAK